MFSSPFPRGSASLAGARPEGLPWLVDSLLVLIGFESAGDCVDLLTGGVPAAARDAAFDMTAAFVCDLCVALALALGLDDCPLGGHGAQVLAMFAKLWAAHWDKGVAALVARAILRVFAPNLRESIRRRPAGPPAAPRATPRALISAASRPCHLAALMPT
jgi:hypothetical protein